MENNYGRTRWYLGKSGGVIKAGLSIVVGIFTMATIILDINKPFRDNKKNDGDRRN